jgi:hypothetical protein
MASNPLKKLDPDWKKKLSDCMKEIGMLDMPFGQITVHISDSKVSEALKQERYK